MGRERSGEGRDARMMNRFVDYIKEKEAAKRDGDYKQLFSGSSSSIFIDKPSSRPSADLNPF